MKLVILIRWWSNSVCCKSW